MRGKEDERRGEGKNERKGGEGQMSEKRWCGRRRRGVRREREP